MIKTLIILLLMTSVCYADDKLIHVGPTMDGNGVLLDYDKIKYSRGTSVIENEDDQIKKLQSDITESRKREDLINQEVHLLQYQIDVLTKKDAK